MMDREVLNEGKRGGGGERAAKCSMMIVDEKPQAEKRNTLKVPESRDPSDMQGNESVTL